MTDQNPTAIVHDFEKLLQYAAGNKIVLTPKQKLIPLRHIKTIIGQFQIQETHEHLIGGQVFKKRDEMEYCRFYFLDLLAVSGSFLKINRKNVLTKGPRWGTFFAIEPRERAFLLFHAFRYDFNYANWFLRGGNFGDQLEEKSEMIWERMLQWRNGEPSDWKLWAGNTVRSSGLRWNSIDCSSADDLAIWGLEYCFCKPLEYFGLVETERGVEEFTRLQSFRLNQIGREYFSRILQKSGHFIAVRSPFSLN